VLVSSPCGRMGLKIPFNCLGTWYIVEERSAVSNRAINEDGEMH
jgi:hypothetical protein